MINEFDKKIMKLSMEGKSYMEVANCLNIDANIVSHTLSILTNPKHENFNPDLYARIQMEKSLNRFSVIDKDDLDTIVSLAKKDYLYIEIACLTSLTEEEVKKRISYLNRPSNLYYDPDLYRLIVKKQQKILSGDWMKRLFKLEELGYDLSKVSHSDLLNKFHSYKNFRDFIIAFVQGKIDKDYLELILKGKGNFGPLNRLLESEEAKKIAYTYVDEETYKNLLHSRMESAQERKKIPVKEKSYEDTKLFDIGKKIDFYYQLVLAFQLSLEQFASVVGAKDSESLYSILCIHLTEKQLQTLNYLWNFRISEHPEDATLREQNAKLYLMAARRHPEHYKAYYQKLIEIDLKYQKLWKERTRYKKLTEEEANIICAYRLKYGLKQQDIPISFSAVMKKCSSLYHEQMVELNEYNKSVAYFYKRKKDYQEESMKLKLQREEF